MSAVNTDEGTILEALNDKLDRDANNLDTSTTNFDVVTAYQIPTAANNYTWYRIYASGWVEQGGVIASVSDAALTVNLPVTMVDTNYSVSLNRATTDSTTLSGINSRWDAYWGKTTTSFGCWEKWGTATELNWEVKGMADASQFTLH